MSDKFSNSQEEMIETAEEIGWSYDKESTERKDDSFMGKNTKSHFPFSFFKEFLGYWDWPPSKQSSDRTKAMMKDGKSPQQIWDVHAEAILQNHKSQKEYHERILADYENSKQNGNTVSFWEKYWSETYNTKLPSPCEMETRWKDWTLRGNSKDEFWEEERKKFKKENGWNFWQKWKVDCKGFSGHETSRCRWRRDFGDESERKRRHFHCVRKQRRTLDEDEKTMYKMFDF